MTWWLWRSDYLTYNEDYDFKQPVQFNREKYSIPHKLMLCKREELSFLDPDHLKYAGFGILWVITLPITIPLFLCCADV